jgi:hypothetical protein
VNGGALVAGGSLALVAVVTVSALYLDWRTGGAGRRQRERETYGELPVTAPCRCGHGKAVHAHYRRGSDCGSCPCPRYRRYRAGRVREQTAREDTA